MISACEPSIIQVWTRLITMTNDFNFKFTREELQQWLQLLEWRSPIWMVIHIFIQICIYSSKSWDILAIASVKFKEC